MFSQLENPYTPLCIGKDEMGTPGPLRRPGMGTHRDRAHGLGRETHQGPFMGKKTH